MRNQVAPRTKENLAAPVPGMPGGAAGVSFDIVQNAPGSPPPMALAPLPQKKGPPPVVHHEVPPTRLYRVRADGDVMYNGCRTKIRAGKIISDTVYDIKHLRNQGILLEEVKGDF